MPSLKEFRNRIDSVKSTQKITKAVRMVVAGSALGVTAACVAIDPAADEAVSDEIYAAAIADIGARITLDMNLSHLCMLQSMAQSDRVEAIAGDYTRGNRNLFSFLAEAFNARINKLRSEGNDVPERMQWIGEAVRAWSSRERYIAASTDTRSVVELFAESGLTSDEVMEMCMDAFFAAASSENMEILERSAVPEQESP